MSDTVWLDKKGYLKKKSEAYRDTDLVVLGRNMLPNFYNLETDQDCFAGAWRTYEEAAEDLERTGFELLGEI